ncbi:hypothetical protein ACEZDB_35770 [Streptacidiphilus sp. N1-3]|uniref:Ig-like domain-containing protein n=1 Tax=Streptacidiphilus alkalitolerans TaxID=3342712 RepID=A0ABV6XCJ8_9ACTN
MRRTTVIAAVLAVLLTSTAGACGAGGSAAPDSGTDCVWDLQGPTITATSDTWTLVGAVRVTCVEEPQSYSHQLYAQWQSTGAAWQTEDSANSHGELPPPPLLVGVHKCRVGNWRLHWDATGVGPDGRPGTESVNSQEVYVHTCP